MLPGKAIFLKLRQFPSAEHSVFTAQVEKFDEAKFDEMYEKKQISHNLKAPKSQILVVSLMWW